MRNIIKYFFIIFAIVTACLTACKTNQFRTSAEVWTVREDKDLLVVGARGYANNEREAMLDAEKRAFETLFYRGFPNTSYKLPMISNDNNTSSLLSNFFSTGTYRNFISSSVVTSPLKKDKVKRTKQLDMKLVINTFSLKRHLEQNGIIKKFGL